MYIHAGQPAYPAIATAIAAAAATRSHTTTACNRYDRHTTIIRSISEISSCFFGPRP